MRYKSLFLCGSCISFVGKTSTTATDALVVKEIIHSGAEPNFAPWLSSLAKRFQYISVQVLRPMRSAK